MVEKEEEKVSPIIRIATGILGVLSWAVILFSIASDLAFELASLIPSLVFAVEMTHVTFKGKPLIFKGKLIKK